MAVADGRVIIKNFHLEAHHQKIGEPTGQPCMVHFSDLGNWLIVIKPLTGGAGGSGRKAAMLTWGVPDTAAGPRQPGMRPSHLPRFAKERALGTALPLCQLTC